MNRTFNACAVTFGVIACFLIFLMDFKKAELLHLPHCLLTTAVDGVAPGMKQAGHPLSPVVITAREPVMERLSNEVLADWSPQVIPEYTYSPVWSRLFAPLSLLPLSWSLFVFQALSMAALITSVYRLVSLHEEKDHWSVQTIILSFAALAFLPVLMALKVGSADFLAGILPLSFGYFFLLKKRPVRAGLVLSLTLLKPQYLLTALFVSAAMVVDKKRQKCLTSLIVGFALLSLADIFFFAGGIWKEVWACFLLDTPAYAELSPGLTPQMATNFPGSLLILLPSAQQAILKPWVCAFAMFIGLLGFIAALRIWQAQIIEDKKIAMTFLLAMFVTPFVIPGFFVEQFCLYALAAMITLLADWSAFTYWDFKSIIFMSWILITFYTAPLFFNKIFIYPLLLVFFLLLFYRRLLLIVETIRVKEATPEVPVVQN